MKLSKLVALPLCAVSGYAVAAAAESTIGFDLLYDMVSFADVKNVGVTAKNSSLYPKSYMGLALYMNHMFTQHLGTEGGFYYYLAADKSYGTPSVKTTLKRKGLYGDFIIGFNPSANWRLGITLGTHVEDSLSGATCVVSGNTAYDGTGTGTLATTPFDVVPMVVGLFGNWNFTRDMGLRLGLKYTIHQVAANKGEFNINLGLNYRID